MERLVLKIFLKFLEDKKIVDHCHNLSVLIANDFKVVFNARFNNISSKSDGVIYYLKYRAVVSG